MRSWAEYIKQPVDSRFAECHRPWCCVQRLLTAKLVTFENQTPGDLSEPPGLSPQLNANEGSSFRTRGFAANDMNATRTFEVNEPGQSSVPSASPPALSESRNEDASPPTDGPPSVSVGGVPEGLTHLDSVLPSTAAETIALPTSQLASITASNLSDRPGLNYDGTPLYTAALSHNRPAFSESDERRPTADWTAVDFFATKAHSDPSSSEELTDSRTPTTGCRSESEAHLLRYFVQEWGPLLDATDDSRQFSTSIPRLAWTESPCLLYAIFALAACQLSKISDRHSIQTSRFYRKKCAQVLVPILLEDPYSVHEAPVFATYVLLRVYDHLTGRLPLNLTAFVESLCY